MVTSEVVQYGSPTIHHSIAPPPGNEEEGEAQLGWQGWVLLGALGQGLVCEWT